jgi:hypothetical protein
MNYLIILAIVILLVILLSSRSEYLTDAAGTAATTAAKTVTGESTKVPETEKVAGPASSNIDKYGQAIAANQEYSGFIAAIGEPKFDVTVFDSMKYFQSQQWLSKANLAKILKKDMTGLDQTPGTNAY